MKCRVWAWGFTASHRQCTEESGFRFSLKNEGSWVSVSLDGILRRHNSSMKNVELSVWAWGFLCRFTIRTKSKWFDFLKTEGSGGRVSLDGHSDVITFK
ncbi:hypothetical protein AVEN_21837-1 [Araneus ventricosus]|uniref:Uncharacterized protein n=1 Tax=Araneus ventricosus TaxID=182803 RepID=A0A4Y2RVQ9_ARAVE|nr:hypothetical protein AVEN_21837-1 [Araneus ventricosus]